MAQLGYCPSEDEMRAEVEAAKHTPEPWERNGKRIERIYLGMKVSEQVELIARVYGEDSEANARRIVACVNACAGINPKAVPELVEALEAAELWIEETLPVLESMAGGETEGGHGLLESIRAALAKARGEA